MGHSSDVITRQIYTHLFAADTAAYVEAMGRPTARTTGGTVTPMRASR
jgi:hypothetical protein